MTVFAARKSVTQSRVECLLLHALLQGVPFYSAVALAMILIDTSEFAGERFGIVIFIAMASTFHALITPWLGPKFPHFFRHYHEPLFVDPTLSFSDKITRWLAQPKTALQLLGNLLTLSVLAASVASIR